MISLVCPTRGRPDALAEMIRTAADTAARPSQVEVVAYIDRDDPALDDYRKADYPELLTPELALGDRCTLSDTWNRAARHTVGDVLMLAADDLRFRTHGWDVIVEGAAAGHFADGIGVVYGRDGHADGRMATHPFVTRQWVDVVGRFTAPHFVADYVDLWIHDVATRVGRLIFLPGLLIEHMHPSFGKGEWDDNHRERLARAKDAGLPELWDQLEPERAAEAARLMAAIEGHE